MIQVRVTVFCKTDGTNQLILLTCVCVCVSAAGVVSCSFDEGLCVWMTDSEGDLKWEIKDDPAGKTHQNYTEYLVINLLLPITQKEISKN